VTAATCDTARDADAGIGQLLDLGLREPAISCSATSSLHIGRIGCPRVCAPNVARPASARSSATDRACRFPFVAARAARCRGARHSAGASVPRGRCHSGVHQNGPVGADDLRAEEDRQNDVVRLEDVGQPRLTRSSVSGLCPRAAAAPTPRAGGASTDRSARRAGGAALALDQQALEPPGDVTVDFDDLSAASPVRKWFPEPRSAEMELRAHSPMTLRPKQSQPACARFLHRGLRDPLSPPPLYDRPGPATGRPQRFRG
jgi:hypothetical protein